ncbi:MAG: hypothetical protein IKH74_00865 [Lachnospiraceae bacterium]|nr:hypothetical protein [Lachnospiraceae bacterium]
MTIEELLEKPYWLIDILPEGERNPDPAKIAGAMRSETVWLRTGDALIMSEPDDLCMTLYNPDEALLQLVRTLAASEGLYVWKGTES